MALPRRNKVHGTTHYDYRMTSFLVLPAAVLLLSATTQVGVVTAELFYSTTRPRRTATATAFVVPTTTSQRNRINHVVCSSKTKNNVNEAVVAPATDTATTNVFERHFQQVDNTFLTTQQQGSTTSSVVLTYLEHNGWIMSFKEINLLIDPILEGSLNFGLPLGIYEAKRQTILPLEGMIQPGKALPSLDRIDALVITQGLDDHAHLKTLEKLSLIKKFQNIPIIAPPSAQNVVKEAGFSKHVQVLNHGDVYSFSPNKSINIRATTGALVGPPWQTRENGYIFEEDQGLSIYLEPHVEFNQQELRKLSPVDIVISPIVGQQIDPLGGYKIVQGPQSTIDLLKILKPKYLVPMNNGDLQSQGILSDIVSQVGTKQDVPNALSKTSSTTQFVNVIPGQPIVLSKS